MITSVVKKQHIVNVIRKYLVKVARKLRLYEMWIKRERKEAR